MKKLALVGFALACTTQAHAGFTVCVLQKTACDKSGARYLCEFCGWATPSPNPFCSETDQSTRQSISSPVRSSSIVFDKSELLHR